MAFPNFHGRERENASNFLDDLEMAFLVSGRDEDAVKLKAFPLVLREEAKSWFAGLLPEKKRSWEVLKDAFIAKFSAGNNPEELWRRLTSLRQIALDSYHAYETHFLTLWAQWELSLPEGEGAPDFLKKEKFLAGGLSPSLQEKVKGKFPENFEEAMQWARLKDRKLQFQAHVMRRESQPSTNVMGEQQPHAPPTTPADPHLELLQRVTNQLNELSVNMFQGSRMPAQPSNEERAQNAQQPPRRQQRRQDYFCYNCGEVGHGMYFCPHPRRHPGNGQGRGPRRQVTPPRDRPQAPTHNPSRQLLSLKF